MYRKILHLLTVHSNSHGSAAFPGKKGRHEESPQASFNGASQWASKFRSRNAPVRKKVTSPDESSVSLNGVGSHPQTQTSIERI
jgi:hypothetical protein